MTPLRICFLWHFHQPDYRRGDEFYLPWVYLHTVKDYVDLVKLMQEYPVKHTINVVPSLLLQVDEYLAGRKDPVQKLCELDPAAFTSDECVQLSDGAGQCSSIPWSPPCRGSENSMAD